MKGNWQLDHSVQSEIVVKAFSTAEEIEQDLISQRTKEALRATKAAGIPLGRPKKPAKSKLDPCRLDIETLLANGSTKKFIAARYRTTSANLHKWLKKHEINRPAR